MSKKLLVSWGVAGIAIAVAVVGWSKAAQYRDRAVTAENTLTAQERLKVVSYDLTDALFVRFVDDTVTFSTPRQISRDGQVFVDRIEQTAVVTDYTEFGGVADDNLIGALQTLKEGAPIRVSTAVGASGNLEIAVIVLVQ